MLRMSTLFVRTLREDPADAEIRSHRLLVRAGYIRRVAPGSYSWLPLGWRVVRNIERIVRAEMDALGAQEVHFPALLPREPYEATGRWQEYGDDIFKLVDRKGADYLLGPTHEEMFTLMAREVFTSYKDLPAAIYQVQWKFRDEQRSRGGLLRAREFAMKDSYTFDRDDDGLAAAYQRHRAAYQRIFDRLGLDYVIVQALSGAMGGSQSEEFLCPLPVGEDTFVRCTSCDYAANVEAMEVPVSQAIPYADAPPAHVEDTPDTPTIESLVALLNDRFPERSWTAADTLKNVVVTIVQPTGELGPLVVGVPGDRDVDLDRLAAQVYPATVEPFEDFESYPQLVRGYIGPPFDGVRYVVDPRVAPGTSWVTGANEDGRHVIGLVAGRDFAVDEVISAADVRAGDPCPRCGADVELARGVEIGHVFALGRKYADALGLRVLDEHDKEITVTMGSYGLGISRALAAVAETMSDDSGLVWPASIAPAQVHVIVAGKSPEVREAADRLVEGLEVEVLYDDRTDVSVGVKFNDAELIGIPTIIVVGRGIADGVVEMRDRRTGERADVPVEQVRSELAKYPR